MEYKKVYFMVDIICIIFIAWGFKIQLYYFKKDNCLQSKKLIPYNPRIIQLTIGNFILFNFKLAWDVPFWILFFMFDKEKRIIISTQNKYHFEFNSIFVFLAWIFRWWRTWLFFWWSCSLGLLLRSRLLLIVFGVQELISFNSNQVHLSFMSGIFRIHSQRPFWSSVAF